MLLQHHGPATPRFQGCDDIGLGADGIVELRGKAANAEIGVRIALGASQRRVGRQVLTESTLLAALGLPLGIFLGYLCADALASLRPALPQSWVLLRGTDLLAGASLARRRQDFPQMDPPEWRKWVTIKQDQGRVKVGELALDYHGDMKKNYEAHCGL